MTNHDEHQWTIDELAGRIITDVMSMKREWHYLMSKQTNHDNLTAALRKLNEDNSKTTHLSPAEREALRDRIAHIEYELGKADVALGKVRR